MELERIHGENVFLTECDIEIIGPI